LPAGFRICIEGAETVERQRYFDEAKFMLSVLHTEIKLSSNVGMTDINRHAEVFYRDLLNLAWYVRLENVNFSQRNFPAIDLAEEGGLCVQVTSTTSTAKIRKTIEMFRKHHLHEKYSRLVILVMGTMPAKRTAS
jgi:DNA-directed RNA polymerase delta subunit